MLILLGCQYLRFCNVEIVYRSLLGGIEKNHENPQSRYCFRMQVEPQPGSVQSTRTRCRDPFHTDSHNMTIRHNLAFSIFLIYLPLLFFVYVHV